jgi:hypothetical protein
MPEAEQKGEFIIFNPEIVEAKSQVQQAGYVDNAVKKFLHLNKNIVSAEEFQKHLSGFLNNVQTALANCQTEYKGYKIDTVEINAEISAEGQIGFMGTHAGIGGKGGITFVFKRA